jgi:predicted metal-dependent hydrolase
MTRQRKQADGLIEVIKDTRYLAFISHFNGDRDYFECHEVMEELWLEEGRSLLLQGLLQASVGLYHWENGNLSGAVKLMTAALDKLNFYVDVALGLDLLALRLDLERSLKLLSLRPLDAPLEAFLLVICDDALRAALQEWDSQGQ